MRVGMPRASDFVCRGNFEALAVLLAEHLVGSLVIDEIARVGSNGRFRPQKTFRAGCRLKWMFKRHYIKRRRFVSCLAGSRTFPRPAAEARTRWVRQELLQCEIMH